MRFKALGILVLVACAPAPPAPGAVRGVQESSSPERRVSPYEVDPPYISDPGFWKRSDLYVMRPDLEPKDRWPVQVLRPSDHGIKIIVLLAGDYRGRSNGRSAPGVLLIESSGTAKEPLLVCYAPRVGADLRNVPHPAERFGKSEARLVAMHIWKQNYQYVHGLTFADGVSTFLIREATGCVVDSCLWHETWPQCMRIRFGAHHNLVQRCVMRRFKKELWGHGDRVAINTSDGACTHNRIISNVILNYTDSYQHTDREGDTDGLGAGTIVDNNFMGFTEEAYVKDASGELMCGENSIDMKMGGTEAEPVRITNNIFFGARAAKKGCGASGSGGYAVTIHRRGTWIEMDQNLFVDNDSGIFLNAFFRDTDRTKGRIDPKFKARGNGFTGVRSKATAFPSRTGHVLTGTSPMTFTGNWLLDCDRLFEREPTPGLGALEIRENRVYGSLDLTPRDRSRLEADGNVFEESFKTEVIELRIPWAGRILRAKKVVGD